MVTSARPDQHEKYELFGLWDRRPRSYSSKMRQNNTTERLGYPIFQIVSENGLADHLRLKIAFFVFLLTFSRSPIGFVSRDFTM